LKVALLCVDVGNTNIVIGLFNQEALVASWRVATRSDLTADELAVIVDRLFELKGINRKLIHGASVCSVVPGLNRALVGMCESYLHLSPLFIGPGVRTGVRVLVENPKEVGADRIVNTAAAYHKYGGPCILIDFGTAVTYDAISENGEYLGGAIAPGLMISLEALVQRTAQLRFVEPTAPQSVIGKSTITSIQSGLMWGFVGQVEGIIRRMRKELGKNTKVIATGGDAMMIASLTRVIETVDPFLTLEGLRIIYGLNRG